jgi:heme exporter protein D
MYFSSVAELIDMGGYGSYVWLAVGFSIFWLGYLLIHPLRKKKQLLREICVQQQIEASRQPVRRLGE